MANPKNGGNYNINGLKSNSKLTTEHGGSICSFHPRESIENSSTKTKPLEITPECNVVIV